MLRGVKHPTLDVCFPIANKGMLQLFEVKLAILCCWVFFRDISVFLMVLVKSHIVIGLALSVMIMFYIACHSTFIVQSVE